MENFELRFLGIVVVAKYNNPSILNRDFLERHGIVPTNALTVDDSLTFCTPGLSQVTYREGLTIISRPDRLEFNAQSANIEKVQPYDVAVKYLEKVSLVKYVAVGINPAGDVRLEPGKNHLVADRLIQKGSWSEHEGQKPDIELNFNYKAASKSFIVKISLGKDNTTGSKILIFGANIHRGIEQTSEEDTSKKAIEIVGKWRDDLGEYKKYVEAFCESLTT